MLHFQGYILTSTKVLDVPRRAQGVSSPVPVGHIEDAHSASRAGSQLAQRASLGAAPPVARQYYNKWPQSSKVPRNAPKYIHACDMGAWTIATYNRSNPSQKTLFPYKCRSWRHVGDCRKWKGAQDYTRIREGIESHPGGYTYLVLTLDQKRWSNVFTAYRGLMHCWARLRKRLYREFGEFHYVTVMEQHRNGWPHVNILVQNDKLAALCAGEGWKSVRRKWLEPHAKASGFGMRTWIEGMRDKDAMAGYFVKLSNQLTAEITKPSQIPVNAPKNFRRIRASKGFLPPPLAQRDKDPEITGGLHQQPIDKLKHYFEMEAAGDELFGQRELDVDPDHPYLTAEPPPVDLLHVALTYVQSKESIIMYLCCECRSESGSHIAFCPNCGASGSYVAKVIAPVQVIDDDAEMTASQLLEKRSVTIDLSDSFPPLQKLGRSSIVMVYGVAGMGKSTWALKFADQVALKTGERVLYNGIEEGFSDTMAEKLRLLEIRGDHILFICTDSILGLAKKIETHRPGWIVIDSISASLSSAEDIARISREYGVGIVFTCHATKDTNYRGSTALAHIADVVVEIPSFGQMRTTKNRYAALSEGEWFETLDELSTEEVDAF